MSVARAEQDSSHDQDAWSAGESAVLDEAVHCAPSVHNTRPWTLTIHDRTAVLRERPVQLAQHDPHGRDRRISCGAALTNLMLATRSLGWTADVEIDVTGGLVTATVTGTRRAQPTETEDRRRGALSDRRSHRHAFALPGLPEGTRDAVLDALTVASDVTGRWISGADDALAVARLLDYAARVFHDNAEYQRELTLWTSLRGSGLHRDAFGAEGLAAVGLTTSRTRLPDESLLAARIRREALLVVGTRADEPHDHVHAGEAVEQAWLEATSRGLAASVMTQPLHLEEVRAGLADRLGMTAVPQVLMRFGYPTERELGDS
ncbi:nitroreductase family protein [Saccharopolyspora phatthalungensis]|uniref:Nitroreductase n=1 Tax=Saccharopolyspora phatthalungensis TaxID=664693 RepID=A0A840QG78_9PSEU|nr:nitroreductase family protein [Saccharopolyspora phatthalungensis]MBB5157515.1 nitroreductase [Saccharopolyspora phatthalungensis]